MATSTFSDLSGFRDDIFGKLVPPRLYTPLVLAFPMKNSASQPQIIESLTTGLEKLAATFPWLAGQAVAEGDGIQRVAKIAPLGKTCRLIVKDLKEDERVPSFDALSQARFPVSMLDGPALTSIAGSPMGSAEEPAAVFYLQANFVEGGLLLNFVGEHTAMDGQGLGQIMKLLDKACRSEAFTEEELTQGNRSRAGIVPLLEKKLYKPGPELNYLIKTLPASVSSPREDSVESSEAAMPKTALPAYSWAYVHFSPTNLLKLKTISEASGPSIVPYITTNDAVSAFIWQATSRARSSASSPGQTSTFARAVDVRPCLSIPSSYTGNMSNHAYTTLPLSSLQTVPIPTIAASLRSSLNPQDLAYGFRSLATQITLLAAISQDSADKSPSNQQITYGANMDFAHDVFFSSWARLPAYSLDFGLGLGYPLSVRRPNFDAFEGLMYLMPQDRKGGIDAAISLRDDHLEALRADEEFAAFGEWIG